MPDQTRISDMIRSEIENISVDRPIACSRAWATAADMASDAAASDDTASDAVAAMSPHATVVAAAEGVSDQDVSCVLVMRGQGPASVPTKGEIASLRETQEALRESERRYRLLAENVRDLIWTSDLGLRWTYVSPSIEALLGYSPAEVMSHAILEVLAPASRQLAASVLAEELALAKERGDAPSRARTLEIELLRKDGLTVWAEVKVAFLCTDEGEPVGLVGVARDVTERKRAAEELQQYALALESANQALHRAYLAAQSATRAKSEFLANMSHEVRTPMAAILGFADMLAERLTQPEEVEAIETIRRNGEYLLRIINDILDLSKIEAGRLQPERLRCSPRTIVEEVVALMRVRADAKGLSLEAEYPGPLPKFITTDPVRVKQILINLIGNAVKFTEKGGVRVVTQLVAAKGEDPKLRFDVIDTGLGMSLRQVERLFEPFVQGDSSTTRRFGGSGLGLCIAKRMAGLLGGDIAVTSAPGEGSTFSATIAAGPLEGMEPVVGTHSACPAETVESTSCPMPPARPRSPVRLDCRILLAEDGPDNQRLVSLLLQKAGAEVIVAENGQQVLEKVLVGAISPRPFDLILMDMHMPVLDGYEATRRLRQAGYGHPIVALTANAMKGDREKCLAAGCDDYLPKPIDRNLLLETIARYVPVGSK